MKESSTIDDELSHPYHRAAALSTDDIGVMECWSDGVLGLRKPILDLPSSILYPPSSTSP
jgi:hypothetical protein